MKPLHLAVAAAVLLVAALLAFVAMSGGERGSTQRAGGRETGTPRDAMPGETVQQVAPGEATAGSGALSIELSIVDPDDQPVGGAEVELDRGVGALRVAADTEGRLRVRGLASGIYDLRARRGKLAGSLHFELKRTTDLGTLKLSAAVAVRGHVYGPQGEPLPGARVEACRGAEQAAFDVMALVRGMSDPEEIAAHATAGDDGAYELLVPAGTLALRATAQGFAQEGEPARPYASDTDGVDFWLMPGVLLQGHVVDARQQPVAAAHVLLVDPMSVFGRRVPKAETATGADGAFSVIVQPTLQSMLVVRAAGYATHMQPNLQLPQTNLVVVLEEGVALRFQAVDEERPEIPAPHVNVIATYRGGFGAGKTDELGRVLLENLPTRDTGMGGEDQVFLWGGGYIAQDVDIGNLEPVDGVVDLGVVKVAPGGTVRGRVLDRTSGVGIPGASVRTFGGLDMQLQFFGSVPARSAADGSFKLTGVPLGAHTLVASHPDFTSDLDPMSLFSGMQGGGAGGPPLFPEGSRDVEKNIEMTPSDVVTGTVIAPDGVPVAGASVEEVGDENQLLSQLLGVGPVTATSDENGAFALGGVRPGREIRIAASHRDFGASEDVRVRAGEPVTLRLAEPLAIRGTVVDEAGAAIAGVRVQAARAAPDAPSDLFSARPSVTDAEGRYLVRNAPKGELTVTFDHPDYAIEKVQTTSQDLGRTVLSRGGTIEGEAVDAEGKPVAGVSLHGWRQGMDPASGRTNASALTDEKGRFAMRGLAEGEYQLRTWEKRYYSEEPKVRTGTLDARIVLRTAGKLVGRVLARGLPVEGASVRAQRKEDFLGWARTGSDGTFTMASLPPDEPFDVTIDHDAFRSTTVSAVRVSDQTQDFVLQAGAEVSGRVVDDRDRGIQGAQVQVRVNGQPAKHVTTDPTGAFTAGGLNDGQISVQLEESNQGFVPSGWIDVAAGARDVRLVATPGESIAGVVRDREGKPLWQVSLQALDGAGEVVATTWVWQEDGAFELRGLKPGTYMVRAQRYVPTEAGAPVQQPTPRDTPGVATGTKNLDLRLD